MAKSPWTEEQRKLIMDTLPEWQQDKNQERRETVLQSLFARLAGGNAADLVDKLKTVG